RARPRHHAADRTHARRRGVRRHHPRTRDDHDVLGSRNHGAPAGRCSGGTRMTGFTSRPHALVVDDEPQMLDIVTFALETQGFSTETRGTAEAAWTAFREQRF